MNRARGISSNIVDLAPQYTTVEIGGKQVMVEDLGSLNDEYYVLRKRNIWKEGKYIDMPPEAQSYLE